MTEKLREAPPVADARAAGAGNLDVMTATAVRVGERIAEHIAAEAVGSR
jgi:acetaldehyde dehydrogenase (acetylating)